jgi:N-acetylmuramoyl-L-alanine amidase
MNYLLILDDGHGKETAGKRTPIFSDGTFMKENEFNREVVNMIYDNLQGIENLDIAFTAEENYDVPLSIRVERANRAWQEHQDYFGKENSKCILISVHANAYGDGTSFNTAKGVSTFCCSTPPAERELAETIHNHLKGGTTQIDRGVQEICFAILKGNMTSCLVECAFMTNLNEANLLQTEEFRKECADEISAGVIEYFGLDEKETVQTEVKYKVYSGYIHELSGSPLDFGGKIVEKSNRSIEEPYCINGSFQWWLDAARQNPYPTSILIIDGEILRNESNHLYDSDSPQSVFIKYKDGTIDMQTVKYASELDYENIECAFGGLGLINMSDDSFRYSPVNEGFFGKFADVLRRSNKTVFGYNFNTKKVYLLAVENCTMSELFDIITYTGTGEEYHLAVMGDGGGAVFLNNADDMVVYGDGRTTYNIIGFKL